MNAMRLRHELIPGGLPGGQRRWTLRAALPALAALLLAGGAPRLGAEEATFRQVLAWQAALESAGYSPGLVDGIEGPRTALATRAFQLASGLPMTGRLDARTVAALELPPAEAAASEGIEVYRIRPEDAGEVSYCPADWNERSRRERLLYPSLADCLAEKFHTSERCLAALNPELDLNTLQAGDEIIVPRLRGRQAPRGALTVEIDLERKLILLLDERGRLQGLLHCSVARELSQAARGECAVVTVVVDPGYTFDPRMWPEVKDVERKLAIPPGPRSPVGVRWIGLDRPGVGIHGAPEPENIGKTGSHGCFRLTNWDASHLARLVNVGSSVRILDRSTLASEISGEERAE